MQNESCSNVATLLDEHFHLAKKLHSKENKVFIVFPSSFFTYEILAKCTLFKQKIVGHLIDMLIKSKSHTN